MYPVEGISIDETMIYEKRIMREIEQHLTMQQAEIIATLLPDVVLRLPSRPKNFRNQSVCVLLFADVSGFTSLCEKYAESGKGGIYKLTATLNGYIGAIVEVIYFYGGDVLKFSGDAILASWELAKDELVHSVIDTVIKCAFYLQETLGTFETEFGVVLKVKTAISCGNILFAIIGEVPNLFYITIGSPIAELKIADHTASPGDILVSSSAWGHCDPNKYEHIYLDHDLVKITKVIYIHYEITPKKFQEETAVELNKLCDYHMEHSSLLKKRKTFEDLNLQEVNGHFVNLLPGRKAMRDWVENYNIRSLRSFVIRPIMQQIDERQPLEYLTEMRDVTIMFVNIVPKDVSYNELVKLCHIGIMVVCSICSKHLGCVNKITLFDKDITILVVFGLRGIKHELESQNALKSGFAIRRELLLADSLITGISIGITSGFVYCGVVGHPLRREYTVIGTPVNTAARLMCAYQDKVTCDQKTYKYSKLSSCYFSLLKPKQLKGLMNVGNIFEYNELFRRPAIDSGVLPPIVGRDKEITLVNYVLDNAIRKQFWESIVLLGESKIGKTRLLKEVIKISEKKSCVTACYFGNSEKVLTPFKAVFYMFEEIYNQVSEKYRLDPTPGGKQPSPYWSFKSLLNVDLFARNYGRNIEKYKQEQVLDLFDGLLARSQVPCVLAIDDLHLIDLNSVKILSELVKERKVLVFATLTSERDVPKLITELVTGSKFQVTKLDGIEPKYVAVLACQFLRVQGIPQKLQVLLELSSAGRPGWIQSCLLRLMNNGNIEIIQISSKNAYNQTIFPSSIYINGPGEDPSSEENMIPIAILGSKCTLEDGDKTLDEITLDLFDSFSSYQKSLLKAAAVLGDVFKSSLLKKLLQSQSTILYLQVIRCMFEERILECEVKNIRVTEPGEPDIPSQLCYCFFEDNAILKRYQMPKYAFCRYIRFRNHYLRKVAYGLLPNNQKREMHSLIMQIMEYENVICNNCTISTTLFRFPKFKEYVKDLNLLNFDVSEIIPFKDSNVVEFKENDSESIFLAESSSSASMKQHWNPEYCNCGPILAQSYSQLVKHAQASENLGKHVYFLVQLSSVLLIMNEYTQAIEYLVQASELCISDCCGENALGPVFGKVMFAKTHSLLGRGYMEMGELNAAGIHFCVALRQFGIPILALSGKLMWGLKLPWGYNWSRRNYPSYGKSKESKWNNELGNCMFMFSVLLNLKGEFESAKIFADRSIFILNQNKCNSGIVWDAYANAIDIYKFQDSKGTKCKLLEKSASISILAKSWEIDTLQLISFGKLLYSCFSFRILNGKLEEGIRIGYDCLELNSKIYARSVLLDSYSLMGFALMLKHRIDEVVAQLNFIYDLRDGKFDEANLIYHSFCLILYLNTSYTLEKLSNCLEFSKRYFFKKVLRSVKYLQTEKLLLTAVILYNCRISEWEEIPQWENLLKLQRTYFKSERVSFKFIYIFIMRIEILLLMIVHEMEGVHDDNEITRLRKQVEQLFQLFDKSLKLWKVFIPRYYLYQAYYKRIFGKRLSSKRLIWKALRLAKLHGNFLDYAWIFKCAWGWKNDLSHSKIGFGGNGRSMLWQMASTQSIQEWQTNLYSLKLPIAKA